MDRLDPYFVGYNTRCSKIPVDVKWFKVKLKARRKTANDNESLNFYSPLTPYQGH